MIQLMGTLAISAWAFLFSFIVFGAIKSTIGVRVTEEDELIGLDVSEHGQPAYTQPSITASAAAVSV
jgi:Amt family ammonium transporter